MALLGAGGLDRALLDSAYADDHPAFESGAVLLTQLGNGWTLTAVTLAGVWVLVRQKRRRSAIALAAGTAVGRLLVELQKIEVARVRPDANPPLVVVHTLSFPSAHSANSMLVYLSLALLIAPPARRARWAAAAGLLSIAIGTSRVMLGVHWPSDVAGGWAFGLLWTMVVLWIDRRDWRRADRSSE
jgi:undecaprenyl-diphosphatase